MTSQKGEMCGRVGGRCYTILIMTTTHQSLVERERRFLNSCRHVDSLDISWRHMHYITCLHNSPCFSRRRSASLTSPNTNRAWTSCLYVGCGQILSHVLNMSRLQPSWSCGWLLSMVCRSSSSMSNCSPRLYQLFTFTVTSSFSVGSGTEPVRDT